MQMNRFLDYQLLMAESALPGGRRCTALQCLSRSSRAARAAHRPPGAQPTGSGEVRVSVFLPVHTMQALCEDSGLKSLMLMPLCAAPPQPGLASPCSCCCAPAQQHRPSSSNASSTDPVRCTAAEADTTVGIVRDRQSQPVGAHPWRLTWQDCILTGAASLCSGVSTKMAQSLHEQASDLWSRFCRVRPAHCST